MLLYKPLCYRCWPEAQQRQPVGLRNANSGEDRSALVTDVAKVFTVKPTPTANNPNHVTVILPKPVTKEVEAKFNALFKPKQ